MLKKIGLYTVVAVVAGVLGTSLEPIPKFV